MDYNYFLLQNNQLPWNLHSYLKLTSHLSSSRAVNDDEGEEFSIDDKPV